ncbi:ashwin [Ambystoma mexicanum]|uniref:ashwin n=1 Tax=Ambystoma mexicanum TaxID=8296 RepID=UPI0037E74D32
MAEGNRDKEPGGSTDLLLLHPELLSEHFLRLTLEKKNIPVESALNDKQKLTDIYVQHVIPLPQRSLPKSRWGKMMEDKRGKSVSPTQQNKSPAAPQGFRKRPLIVFDGSSTRTGIKVKKENEAVPDRLKPPPSGSTTTTIRRISLSPSNSSSQSPIPSPTKIIKLESNNSGAQQSSVPVTHSNNLISIGGTAVVKLKRAAPKEELDESKPSGAKKKIQHVTWP